MRLIKNINTSFFFTQTNRIIRFDPNFLPSSQRGRLSVVCDEGTAALHQTSIAGVAAQQADYLKNTVVGKITEPWVVVFWATFIMYRPKCI